MHHEVERQLIQLLTGMSYSPEQLKPATRFVEDLHLDWLGLLGVVEDLEQHFGIDVPDADLHNMRTLEHAARSVERQLTGFPSPFRQLLGLLRLRPNRQLGWVDKCLIGTRTGLNLIL